MIRLATLGDLKAHRHSLGLYCMPCERWGTADLDSLVKAGRGNCSVTATRFRCRDCGREVEKQVQPPVPALGGAVKYI